MKEFTKGLVLPNGAQSYYNGKYQAILSRAEDGFGRPIFVLSVRREDRKALMDWRDLQWIKNQILGPEVEAVQLFPAESRLVDTSNQYYLFAYDEGQTFPFGFSDRMVTENVRFVLPGHGASEQRPFGDHVRPADLKKNEQKAQKMLLDLFAKVNESIAEDATKKGRKE